MSEDEKNYTFSTSIEDKDLYKAILDTRNFEINLFWQRSNYFLVLNSALAVGFLTQKLSPPTIFLSIFGLLSSVLWYRVLLGSKYWQSRWEDKLAEIERRVAPSFLAFAADREQTDAAINQSLGTKKWFGARALDWQIRRKPSVSRQMMFLAVLFIIG